MQLWEDNEQTGNNAYWLRKLEVAGRRRRIIAVQRARLGEVAGITRKKELSLSTPSTLQRSYGLELPNFRVADHAGIDVSQRYCCVMTEETLAIRIP
jgi:hypothetical protein